MKTLCLIQARINSKRLPRKSLAIIGARPSVFHVWKRASQVATTHVVCPPDDVCEFDAVLPRGVVLSGPGWAEEDDVLSRLGGAIEEMHGRTAGKKPDIVVRLTADCPFVPPEGIQAVIAAVGNGADYATLAPIPNGFDVEAFRGELFQRAFLGTSNKSDREHVTPYIRRTARKVVEVPLFDMLPRYRWTLDDAEDLAWFQEVAREIDCNPPHPTVDELVALMARRPDLVKLDEPVAEIAGPVP